jgi:hypothetical protein
MSIKLVSKKVTMNNDTFAPELEVVVRLPLEQVQDGTAVDPNFYEKFGKEFLSLLEAKNV